MANKIDSCDLLNRHKVGLEEPLKFGERNRILEELALCNFNFEEYAKMKIEDDSIVCFKDSFVFI